MGRLFPRRFSYSRVIGTLAPRRALPGPRMIISFLRDGAVSSPHRGVFCLGDIVTEIFFMQTADIVGIRKAVQLRGLGQGDAIVFDELPDLLELDAIGKIYDGHPLGLLKYIAEVLGRYAEMRGNVGLPDRLSQMLKNVLLGLFDIPLLMVGRQVPRRVGHSVQAGQKLEHQPRTVERPFGMHGVGQYDLIDKGEDGVVFGQGRRQKRKAQCLYRPLSVWHGRVARLRRTKTEGHTATDRPMLMARLCHDTQRLGIGIANDRPLTSRHLRTVRQDDGQFPLGDVGDLQHDVRQVGEIQIVLIALGTEGVSKNNIGKAEELNVILNVHAYIIANHLNFVKRTLKISIAKTDKSVYHYR